MRTESLLPGQIFPSLEKKPSSQDASVAPTRRPVRNTESGSRVGELAQSPHAAPRFSHQKLLPAGRCVPSTSVRAAFMLRTKGTATLSIINLNRELRHCYTGAIRSKASVSREPYGGNKYPEKVAVFLQVDFKKVVLAYKQIICKSKHIQFISILIFFFLYSAPSRLLSK